MCTLNHQTTPDGAITANNIGHLSQLKYLINFLPLDERFERVNIKDVTLFTFEAGKLTKGRKRKPLPQLIQRGETKYSEHELKSVRCVIDKDKLADPHGFMVNGEFGRVSKISTVISTY